MRSCVPILLLPLLVLTCILMRDEACATGTLVTEVTSPYMPISDGLVASVTSSSAPIHRPIHPTNRSVTPPHGRFSSRIAGQFMIPFPCRRRRIRPWRESSCRKDGATAYGSGTLVDVRDQYGLVVTNWHVVSRFARHRRGRVPQRLPLARPAAQGRFRLGPGGAGDLAAADRTGDNRLAAAAARRPAHDSRLRPGPIPHRHRPLHDVLRAARKLSRRRWSSSTSKRGRAIRAGRSSTSAASWPACCSGQGRGPRSAASPRASACFLATLAPDIGQANDQAQVAVADRPAPQCPANERRSEPWLRRDIQVRHGRRQTGRKKVIRPVRTAWSLQ